ncbi:DUF1811 family protein [Paenibacillus hodogayensis]|uniref:DUF1811 family protein n=1 Tax=Paenibacillus hodogayensis TaxID=279208 RepID=A0ABV5VP80_9BACL
MKRYGEMTREELQAELDRLEAEKGEAEFPSQTEIRTQKRWMIKAYLLSAASFVPGTYRVFGFSEPFELTYVNGVMAWGRMGSEEEASFPISMLHVMEDAPERN